MYFRKKVVFSLIFLLQLFFPIIKSAGNHILKVDDLAYLMVNHEQQKRPLLVKNECLQNAAQLKAQDLASRNYFSHTTPEGITPNQHVRSLRCGLADYYPKRGNSIESIAAGRENAYDTFQDLLGSELHRIHVLGLTPFFEEQIQYGIGYASNPSSEYKHYWVILTMP